MAVIVVPPCWRALGRIHCRSGACIPARKGCYMFHSSRLWPSSGISASCARSPRPGSFSAAAVALDYTQPAVSKMVAALERELGATLVDRGARPLRLTDAGEALAHRAGIALDNLAAARLEVEEIGRLDRGRLRVGTFSSAGATLVVDALRELRSEPPRRRRLDRRARHAVGRASAACATASSTWRHVRLPRRGRDARRSPGGDGLEVHHAARRPDGRRAAAHASARRARARRLRRPGRRGLAAAGFRARQPQLPPDQPRLRRGRIRAAHRRSGSTTAR